MKGWRIVRHSLRQVFMNPGGALRVSGLLFLVQILFGFVVILVFGSGRGMMGGGMSGPAALTALFSLAASLWIAVAWHRYVLLGEAPGLLPVFRGDRLLAYLFYSLGYGLIVLVVGWLWSMAVGFALRPVMMGNIGMALVVWGALVFLPLALLTLRMTTALPGVALGKETPFLAGWEATSGASADILVAALFLAALGLLAQVVVLRLVMPVPILGQLAALALLWLQTMVGASVLTTLYGHYIEKRDLV